MKFKLRIHSPNGTSVYKYYNTNNNTLHDMFVVSPGETKNKTYTMTTDKKGLFFTQMNISGQIVGSSNTCINSSYNLTFISSERRNRTFVSWKGDNHRQPDGIYGGPSIFVHLIDIFDIIMRLSFGVVSLAGFLLSYHQFFNEWVSIRTAIATLIKNNGFLASRNERKPGYSMEQIDDEILEFLYRDGNLTALAISQLGERERTNISPKEAASRLEELHELGLVDKVDDNLYDINKDGISYLIGELNARKLE